MSNFNVGDRVRVTRYAGCNRYCGQEGVVLRLPAGQPYYGVHLLHSEPPSGKWGDHLPVTADEIEHVDCE